MEGRTKSCAIEFNVSTPITNNMSAFTCIDVWMIKIQKPVSACSDVCSWYDSKIKSPLNDFDSGDTE
jgi:hypothetical protein